MSRRIAQMPLDGPLFEGAIRVYGQAFILPPYRDPDRGTEVRHRLLAQHAYRPGYRGIVSVEGPADVVGMAYGYTSARGQWWHDQVEDFVGASRAAPWLSHAFELVEVAVRPDRQGRGIGTAIIEDLCRGREEGTCVLSTRTDSDAHKLYGRLGFQVIDVMRFAPGGAPFYIMGRKLGPEDRLRTPGAGEPRSMRE